jgi:hypothetical protein
MTQSQVGETYLWLLRAKIGHQKCVQGIRQKNISVKVKVMVNFSDLPAFVRSLVQVKENNN